MIRAEYLIREAIFLFINPAQARKMQIQLTVIVFPISLAQSKAHAKMDDPVNTCLLATLQEALYILRRIVNEWKDWRQPDNRGDPPLMQFTECGKAFGSRADTRLNDAAKGIIISGKRHLYHTFGLTVDLFQQVDILQNICRFGENRQAKAVTCDQLKCAPGIDARFRQWQIRIGHGTGADHTAMPLSD